MQKSLLKKTFTVNEKILLASYKVSYKLVRRKKPYIIGGKLILPATTNIVLNDTIAVELVT